MTDARSQPDTVQRDLIKESREGVPVTEYERGFRAGYDEAMSVARATPAQPAGMREALIEECAAICDKHATWAEEKIKRNPSSNASQLFATISNTANNCAAMIRDLKALPEPAGVAQCAPDPDQAWRDSTWLGLSASEKACYHWPEDTDLHRQCRAAYIAGATDYALPSTVREAPMDKEMQRALMLDAEKLGHLTGEDHTPLFLADCEACDGQGYIARTIHVYEPGCGFSHPDVEEVPCEACGGNGWFVCEVEGSTQPPAQSNTPMGGGGS